MPNQAAISRSEPVGVAPLKTPAPTPRLNEITGSSCVSSQAGACLNLQARLQVAERRARQMSLAAENARQKYAEAQRNLALLFQENETLRQLSETDGLTGLKNRRAFDTALADELARLARMSGVITVMMIDVDEFKQFNDVHGHLAGDTVLKNVARLLLGCVRSYDHVARFGGEEFAIIFFGTTAQEACRVGDRLRRSVEEFAWPARQVTVSIGVATSASREHNDSLLDRADVAMYRAKEKGRNRMELWEFPTRQG
jgi:diguanylate cyclase (GGDEF)-like protein